ncbi:MAG: hypothetical protein U0V74_13155 [Chitinophagales bacterium]
MPDLPFITYQYPNVASFADLVNTPFAGERNALCWQRELKGDFREIVNAITVNGNITVIEPDELRALILSEEGQTAREIILHDLHLLQDYGAQPVLNLITHYERDEDFPFFPTDVYSFHADSSPIATDTFLCTYFGAPSEIIPNALCEKKVLVPEIRAELLKLYDGPEEGFEAFLSEHFFDLHYQGKPNAQTINCGIGNLWRLAVANPESPVAPCVHRAPQEKPGEPRLLLIC